MKRLCLILLMLPLAAALSAQEKQEFPKPRKMYPEHTEFWLPQPPVVTPGSFIATVEVPAPGAKKAKKGQEPVLEPATLPASDAFVSAPSDAIVLFDGSGLDEWTGPKGVAPGWKVEDGVLTIVPGSGEIVTKRVFHDFQLHIEWREPVGLEGESQGRGNSGVYLQGQYEVQVLDSYANPTYASGGAGSIYKQHAPLVNAMRPQGEWNVYDIIYEAPTFKKDGTFRTYPHVTVLHNGILIQNHTEILGTTEYVGFPKQRAHGDGPIMLQDHGNPVSFRNIWIREL